MAVNNKQVVVALLGAVLISVGYLSTFLLPSTSSGYGHFETRSDPRASRLFRNVLVHLDLKGAPPRVEYLEQLFSLLAAHYVDGVLLEYEDTFPYSGELEQLRREAHYSEGDVRRIQAAAERSGLEVIPLIQSFGHLEFVLKKQHFRHLSEDFVDLNTICISDDRSVDVVRQMIVQMRALHPNSTRIHIGADEAYHVAEDVRCHERMEKSKVGKSELKMEHIARVGMIAKEAGFERVFAWNDMFDKEPESAIRAAKIHDYIVPVVWGYREDVTDAGYFPDGLFDRIANVFDDGFYVASAFKGADGVRQQFSNISRYLANQMSYVKLMSLHPNARNKVQGVIVTGWSRFSHFAALCELLPVAVPSLIVDLFYLNYQLSARDAWKAMKHSLKCGDQEHFRGLLLEWAVQNCSFPGANVYKTVMNDWKRVVDRKTYGKDVPGESDAVTVLQNLRRELTSFIGDSDADEVYNQYLQDYHAIQRFQPATFTP